jgi:hypothetical protein
MVIEDVEIKYDVEDGSSLIVKGRSAESILDRRIIWTQTVLTGSLQNGIKSLIDNNIISPTDTDRTIPNFVFELSTDPVITALTVDAQYMRDNLYEVIFKLCEVNNIGFKLTLDEITNNLTFKLYAGADRSYSQSTNAYVVYSRGFDNLISSEYKKLSSKYKNFALVAGEEIEGGGEEDRMTTMVGTTTGMSRKEIYVNASDSSQIVDDVELTDEQYLLQLGQRGLEKLAENNLETSFDCEVDQNASFTYGEDFFLGDIVQLETEYNISGRARVTEIIRSQNNNGINMYPTFDMLD